MSETETREFLTADDTGRWLVDTLNSQHIFDLDNGVYRRTHNGDEEMVFDGTDVPLDKRLVIEWPKVGGVFLFVFPLAVTPQGMVGTLRTSSEILSIRKADPNE